MWASPPAILGATAAALETGEAVDGRLPITGDGNEPDWEIA